MRRFATLVNPGLRKRIHRVQSACTFLYPSGVLPRHAQHSRARLWRLAIAIESIEEESDDWEDVLRLPTRGREAHRRGHGGVAVPRDGSRRTRDGEAHTALQACEWRGLPARGSCGGGEAADGVDWTALPKKKSNYLQIIC